MTVLRVSEFSAVTGKSAELYTFLESLIPYISSSDGCISCELLKHHDEENQFMMLERWESTEYHQLSVTNFPQQEMQAAMSLFGAPPKGTYYQV